MNLFDFTTGIKSLGCKPRSATMEERNAYLRWLAQRDGIAIPANATFGDDGIRVAKELIVAMPGYGDTRRAILEVLDDDGNVIRSTPIAMNSRGQMTLTKAQVQEATGLKPLKSKRVKTAPIVKAAPISDPVAHTAPTCDVDPIRAIEERLAQVEAALASLSAQTRVYGTPEAACDGDAQIEVKPKRSAAHERAIRRAWSERKEARRQRSGASAFRHMLDIEENQVRNLRSQLSRVQEKRIRAVANAHRHWRGRMLGRVQCADLKREARTERAARQAAVTTGRGLVLQARAQRDAERGRADASSALLSRLKRSLADPMQPERASDISRLVRERDEARTANAALQQRSERAERAAHDLAERFEDIVSRMARAEAAVRSIKGKAA